MMIVGNGDIASVLRDIDREDRIYFASGVSNSSETRESEYQREADLLLAQDRLKHLIYFGSLCVFYSQTRYARHKKEMEDLVRLWFPRYTIIRMGNITWGSNPHTLINFLRNKIAAGEPYEIQDDVFRYIVDKYEFIYWISKIPYWNCELTIPGRRMEIIEIIAEFCLPDPAPKSLFIQKTEKLCPTPII